MLSNEDLVFFLYKLYVINGHFLTFRLPGLYLHVPGSICLDKAHKSFLFSFAKFFI